MITPNVTIDKQQMARVRRLFRNWPQAVPKIYKESINRTASKSRTLTVNRISQLSPGMKKKYIRNQIRLFKATLKRWSALIRVSSKGVPIGNLGMKAGRAKKTYYEATAKQSAWLFYNVLRPKYGDTAVFSRRYRLSRKSHQNITYRSMGKTETVTEPGAFVQTVRNPWAGGGARGHKGVFVRRGGFGGRALRELYGPGVGEMLTDNVEEINKIKAESGKGLALNINSRIRWYLEKAKTRRAG